MNVLSLFDGISCGKVALDRAGIKVDKYYASEIDKYAIQVSEKNHQDIIRLGDVTKWREWGIDFSSIDLVIGGSPCQGFSLAGKQMAFDDPRSKLFFEFSSIVKFIDPKYFLLENVNMRKEILDAISNELGVNPIRINSKLVSAQNRDRFYWANFHIDTPTDKNICLADVLEYGYADRDKSYCIDANYYKGGNFEQYFIKSRRQIVFTNEFSEQTRLLCLKNPKSMDKDIARKLSPVECERLQTIPDDYTLGISNTQRYKALGNSWTVDVIAHIFRCMVKEQK